MFGRKAKGARQGGTFLSSFLHDLTLRRLEGYENVAIIEQGGQCIMNGTL
jgi:hypothetical protein